MNRYKFLLFLVFFSCLNKLEVPEIDKKLSKKKSYKLNVIIDKIDKYSFNYQIVTNGKISAVNKIDLRFNSNEKIAIISIYNGQNVNKGKLLASLQNNLLKSDIEKSFIDQEKSEIKLEEEKVNYNNNLTKERIRNLEIKSGVLQAKNNLERVQIIYNQTLLKAPFSGVIANLEKKEGDFITTADVFCTLINPNKLEVFFSVLENEFQFVSIGQEIEILSFVNNDESLKGRITEINPLVDKNGLIKIKAKVLSKETNLLDGMNVKVIINKPLKDVIVIPKEALVLRSNRQVVFTLEKGLAKWNYVEVAGENNNSYAIKKGLKVSDTIIVSGNLNLSHDAKVNTTFIDKEINIK
ncbi:efflux RND transporter periplasmic adaptor subunit [Polaribacter litorisediminis]|uniref:efflux RND transporter periplasmic adaptor subunit n=1 Tax=Polaribacter litorisediminis TaxID=1908341 RepID=UPI001CBF69A5|nr:efflux RND transporter periplasmic adaptor subunit [Polaribacter litorisediminis]UAM98040.1 efflux RND transporter periplasmic adaptor subunit [Polaribacter litorisediminis]